MIVMIGEINIKDIKEEAEENKMRDKRIWKYFLREKSTQTLHLPADAKLLKILVLVGAPTLYALVDLRNKEERIVIKIFGTGHPIPNRGLEYIDTYSNEAFVWHVFKEI